MRLSSHDRLMDRLDRQLDMVPQISAFNSADRIPGNTPKFSGQLRASTNIGINGVDDSVTLVANYQRNAIRGELAAATARFKLVSSRIRAGDTVYISNDLPYAAEQEFQRGHLMFTKSAQLWPVDVANAVRESRQRLGLR